MIGFTAINLQTQNCIITYLNETDFTFLCSNCDLQAQSSYSCGCISRTKAGASPARTELLFFSFFLLVLRCNTFGELAGVIHCRSRERLLLVWLALHFGGASRCEFERAEHEEFECGGTPRARGSCLRKKC